MSEVPESRNELRWSGLGAAGLQRSGCAGALTSPEDLRVAICPEGAAGCVTGERPRAQNLQVLDP